MNAPRHLSHLFDRRPNNAPTVLLTPLDRSPMQMVKVFPLPPPIRTGSGPAYIPPPATPPGITTR